MKALAKLLEIIISHGFSQKAEANRMMISTSLAKAFPQFNLLFTS
jgi:hypothetical protein